MAQKNIWSPQILPKALRVSSPFLLLHLPTHHTVSNILVLSPHLLREGPLGSHSHSGGCLYAEREGERNWMHTCCLGHLFLKAKSDTFQFLKPFLFPKSKRRSLLEFNPCPTPSLAPVFVMPTACISSKAPWLLRSLCGFVFVPSVQNATPSFCPLGSFQAALRWNWKLSLFFQISWPPFAWRHQ